MRMLSMNKRRLNNPISSSEESALTFYKKNMERVIKAHVLKLEYPKRELNDEQKKYQDILIQNQDCVDIVLDTLFQWFGSSVGKTKIKRMMDSLQEEAHVL